MKEKISLIQWLINQHRTEAYRKGNLSGMKHPQVDAKLLHDVGGRGNLIRQARELEKDPVLGMTGRIRFQWRDMGEDIQKIDYYVDIIPELCRRMGIEDLRERQLRHIGEISERLDHVKDIWLSEYYEELKRRLQQGKDVKEMEDEKLFQCLNVLVQLEKPMWNEYSVQKYFAIPKHLNKHIKRR